MKKIKLFFVLMILLINGLLIVNKSAANFSELPSGIQRGNKTPYNGVWMCTCPQTYSADLCYCAN